jgi:hypothetical protein
MANRKCNFSRTVINIYGFWRFKEILTRIGILLHLFRLDINLTIILKNAGTKASMWVNVVRADQLLFKYLYLLWNVGTWKGYMMCNYSKKWLKYQFDDNL